MSATIFALPNAYQLIIDQPFEDDGVTIRDDILLIKVWTDTTAGFTPSDANLSYAGQGLSITVNELASGVVHFVKYSIISEIDPDVIDISGELSVTPIAFYGERGSMIFYDNSLTSAAWNPSKADAKILAVTGSSSKTKGDTVTQVYGSTWSITKYWDGDSWEDPGKVIDGNLIVTGSISATALSATSIYGKTLHSNNYVSNGSVSTAFVEYAGLITAFDLYLEDTSSFKSSGFAAVIFPKDSERAGSCDIIRYTGKTSSKLSGCFGIRSNLHVGAIVVPLPYSSAGTYQTTSSGSTKLHISNAFAASGSAVVRFYDNTFGTISWTGITSTNLGSATLAFTLTGVSGISKDISVGSPIISTENQNSLTTLSSRNYSTITLTGSDDGWYADSGVLQLRSTGDGTVLKLPYSSRSGLVFTLTGSYFSSAAKTYTSFPKFDSTIIGQGNGTFSALSNSASNSSKLLGEIVFINLSAGSTSYLSGLLTDTLAATTFGASKISLQKQWTTTSGMSTNDIFRYAESSGQTPDGLAIGYSDTAAGAVFAYIQPMINRHYFSSPGATYQDFIYFDDSTNTFTLCADGDSASPSATGHLNLNDLIVGGSISGGGSSLAIHVGSGTNSGVTSLYGGGSSSVNYGAVLQLFGCNYSGSAVGRVYLSTANFDTNASTDIPTSRMYINASSASSGAGDVIFYVNDSEVFRLNHGSGASNGFIASLPTYNLTTANSANMYVHSTGVFYRSTSAEKYKRDIEPIEPEYYSKVWDLDPIWYRSNCSDDDRLHSYWGISADKAAKIDPRLVHFSRPLIKEFIDDIKYSPAVIDEYGTVVIPKIDYQPGGFRYVEDLNAEPVPEGFAYDRLPVLLLAATKDDHFKLIDVIARLEQLEKKIESN